MPRGSIAKASVEKQLATAFGADYIGNVGGKIYLWANDGNERVQIAIAMTCPKTMIDAVDTQPAMIETKEGSVPTTGWNFDDDAPVPVKATPKPQITEQEKKDIADLMARLGL